MAFDFTDIKSIGKLYQTKLSELTTSEDDRLDLITKVAETEKIYLIAREQAATKFRLEGQPATLIKDLVGGKTATQKFEFEIAKGVQKAHEANIKRLYAGIDALRSFLSSAKSQMDIR